MLDGGPIEDPFSILSSSIEHPLGSGGNQERSRGGKGEKQGRRMGEAGGKQEGSRG
jgi:hypothetical protein